MRTAQAVRNASAIFLLLLLWLVSLPVQAQPPAQVTNLQQIGSSSLGEHAFYLQEGDKVLSLKQAMTAFKANQFNPGHNQVLTFGIGAKATWINLPVENSTQQSVYRRLIIDISWLDDIQVFIHNRSSGELMQYRAGDAYPFNQRPEFTRTFEFDTQLQAGISDIFLRVDTADPMVVPLYLLDREQLKQKNNAFTYSSGFSYGYLFALVAFNAMLYFGLRDFRYLLYAFYLTTFILMNLSYNGHGFMWLWPNSVMLQKFGQPFFMLLFGNMGIIFSLYFLDIRKYSLAVFRAAIGFVLVMLSMLLIAVLIDHQQMALLTAFTFTVFFIIVMIALGIKSLLMGNPEARYFLPALLMGMTGAGFTALSVWGGISFNQWTYRAVEIGMLLESTLLALALAFRFRRVEEEHLKAHRLSLVDPLTNLYNRRAFANNANNAWSAMVRHQRVLCVIMLDIDHFKNINDEHGHDCGDAVLTEVGKVLLASTRQEDTAARWGGEEFILLLPETELAQATVFAERLREKIEAMIVHHTAASVDITASFGVASSQDGTGSIESVIQLADSALYEAKTEGKNRVIVYSNDLPGSNHPLPKQDG